LPYVLLWSNRAVIHLDRDDSWINRRLLPALTKDPANFTRHARICRPPPSHAALARASLPNERSCPPRSIPRARARAGPARPRPRHVRMNVFDPGSGGLVRRTILQTWVRG
jgi:hypothetical protein